MGPAMMDASDGIREVVVMMEHVESGRESRDYLYRQGQCFSSVVKAFLLQHHC